MNTLAPVDPQRSYSTNHVADYLSASPRQVNRLIDSGDLPAFRLGRAKRVLGADLLAFREARKIHSPTN